MANTRGVARRRTIRELSIGYAVLCLLSGCADPGPPVGDVSITVKYDGQPVTQGSVNLAGINGATGGSAKLTDTGAVQFHELLTGKYKVFVFPPELDAPIPDPVHGGFMSAPVPKDIPAVFHSEMSTPISVDVQAGANSFTFDLKELDTTKTKSKKR